jgi:hypothetical protein
LKYPSVILEQPTDESLEDLDDTLQLTATVEKTNDSISREKSQKI